MRTCSKCAVEVEEGIERCPLCGTPLREGLPGLATEAGEGSEPEVSESSVRRWLWEVISLLALTAAGILIAIDLASGFDVTWSRYPLSAIAFLWICATSAIALARRPLALVAALAAAVVAFLLVLELITGGSTWFLPLALPLVVMAIAVSAGAWLIVSRLHLSLLPALAVVVLGCGFAAIGTVLEARHGGQLVTRRTGVRDFPVPGDPAHPQAPQGTALGHPKVFPSLAGGRAWIGTLQHPRGK
jgi:hypothetical protein